MTPADDAAYRTMLAQTAALEAKGFAPLSDWWAERLLEWYEGGARRLVACVGRRGGKTINACRIAVAEATGREWPIPRGERGILAYVSASKEHAGRRVHTIGMYMQALGHRVDVVGGAVRMLDRPIDVCVYTANYRTITGDTWIGLVCDEVARWRDDKTSRNPASEVLASARPALRTMRAHGAKEVLISTPWGRRGTFYEYMQKGNTKQQHYVHAPTWIATNDWITEQETLDDEPDELVWRREYLAEPMPTATGLDSSCIRWLDAPPAPQPDDVVTAGCDLAMRRNSSTFVKAYRRNDAYLVADIREWRPETSAHLEPSVVCAAIATAAQEAGHVVADQYYREALREAVAKAGLVLYDAPHHPADALVRLRSVMRDGNLSVYAPHLKERLRSQIDATELVPTTGGGLRVVYPDGVDGSHGDLVAALALAVWHRGGSRVEHPTEKPPEGWTPDEWADANPVHDSESWYDDGDYRRWAT